MRNWRWIGLAILVLITSIANAQVYKWVDEHGKTQYSDRSSSPGEAKNEKKINIKKGVSTTDDSEPAAKKA